MVRVLACQGQQIDGGMCVLERFGSVGLDVCELLGRWCLGGAADADEKAELVVDWAL